MRLLPLPRRFAACSSLKGFPRDRRAVTSIEYVIIAIIIVLAVIGGVSRIGVYLSNDFNEVSTEL